MGEVKVSVCVWLYTHEMWARLKFLCVCVVAHTRDVGEVKASPKTKTEIKDVAVTCNNPLTHIQSHPTAAVLQYVELCSLLVIPAVEHAHEAV